MNGQLWIMKHTLRYMIILITVLDFPCLHASLAYMILSCDTILGVTSLPCRLDQLTSSLVRLEPTTLRLWARHSNRLSKPADKGHIKGLWGYMKRTLSRVRGDIKRVLRLDQWKWGQAYTRCVKTHEWTMKTHQWILSIYRRVSQEIYVRTLRMSEGPESIYFNIWLLKIRSGNLMYDFEDIHNVWGVEWNDLREIPVDCKQIPKYWGVYENIGDP